MNRYKHPGWYGESYRHYLAAKGIKTAKYLASNNKNLISSTITGYSPVKGVDIDVEKAKYASPLKIDSYEKDLPVGDKLRLLRVRDGDSDKLTVQFEGDKFFDAVKKMERQGGGNIPLRKIDIEEVQKNIDLEAEKKLTPEEENKLIESILGEKPYDVTTEIKGLKEVEYG